MTSSFTPARPTPRFDVAAVSHRLGSALSELGNGVHDGTRTRGKPVNKLPIAAARSTLFPSTATTTQLGKTPKPQPTTTTTQSIEQLLQEKANDREFFEIERWAYVEALRDAKGRVAELEAQQTSSLEKLKRQCEETVLETRRTCTHLTAERDALIKQVKDTGEMDMKLTTLTKELESAKSAWRAERDENEQLRNKLMQAETSRATLALRQTSSVIDEKTWKTTVSDLRAELEHVKGSHELVIRQKDSALQQCVREREQAMEDAQALRLQLQALETRLKKERDTIELQREYMLTRQYGNAEEEEDAATTY